MAKNKNKKKQNGKELVADLDKKLDQFQQTENEPEEIHDGPAPGDKKHDATKKESESADDEQATQMKDSISTTHQTEIIEELKRQLEAKDQEILRLESNSLKDQLEQKTQECEKYQSNYQALLSRLSSMKSVFQKMKESETELENTQSELKTCKETIKVLEGQVEEKQKAIDALNLSVTSLKDEAANLNAECDKLSKDYAMLKKSAELKDDEQTLEIKRLETSNKKYAVELKELRSEIEEYLIIVNEEKISKKNLLHEMNETKAKNESLITENKALQEERKFLQDQITDLEARIANITQTFEGEKHDLQHQIETNITKATATEQQLQEAQSKLVEAEQKLARITDLENEIKQKQLTIGKLRHETIVLNEHLMKAMKLVKKESTTETVDRELISNLLISFLQIPRADAKKFEVLQLISNFLNWDDEKKRHAGLLSSHSKTNSNSVLNVPSTPLVENSAPRSGQSFVSLWTEFLEKESTPSK
ncbi:hypothetical protein KL949_003725 [Ogataea haglerorum]|uniref:uncharacterized protein n=1 Tax=Ogataea haglerorum TaxID=1937702 RepID=UPI001C893794|nr:uncharacterized protein KL911_004298 [Ogataea haglerorum]KAG7693950.1 hypothetical protein KL951_004429 [Ogataea haglerorum]KAG7716000.1 hypothetical protein KL913_003813 [Ogataea haglerorum]KAG7716434.1 hypothetical protein KL949_003725 [Ogataea haglerorum]KAG7746682.1 hypothetical protein KL912_004259 [Ogataea haglerorum]KAG7752052.1 hypothetical protein KL911_004298 [Ogataea haglerorum]